MTAVASGQRGGGGESAKILNTDATLEIPETEAALLAHEVARALHVETLSHHRAVSTVRRSEGIVAVDVCQFPAGKMS